MRNCKLHVKYNDLITLKAIEEVLEMECSGNEYPSPVGLFYCPKNSLLQILMSLTTNSTSDCEVGIA